MSPSLDPLVTGLIAVVVSAVVVGLIITAVRMIERPRRARRAPRAARGAARRDAPSVELAAPAPDAKALKLPKGADAALWSIVEAVPDPRNHLALTRDLSGEVRLTAEDRELARALFADQPRHRPAPTTEPARQPAAAGGVAVIELRDAPVVLVDDDLTGEPGEPDAPTPNPRASRAWRREQAEREAERDDDLDRTAEFFFSGEPRLTRF